MGIVARTVGMVHTSASRRQAGDGVQADDVLVKAPRMMGMGSWCYPSRRNVGDKSQAGTYTCTQLGEVSFWTASRPVTAPSAHPHHQQHLCLHRCLSALIHLINQSHCLLLSTCFSNASADTCSQAHCVCMLVFWLCCYRVLLPLNPHQDENFCQSPLLELQASSQRSTKENH